MDLTPYVERLRHDLAAAAEAGGPDVAAAAERLGLALDPAIRLALMEAISQAAAEITAELPTGGVDVRLTGRELDFVVATPPVEPAAVATPVPSTAPVEEGEDTLARVTLRLPESVKTRAEDLAARSGTSLNTWLVSVLRAATSAQGASVELDLSSIPFLGGGDTSRRGRGTGERRMTGWV